MNEPAVLNFLKKQTKAVLLDLLSSAFHEMNSSQKRAVFSHTRKNQEQKKDNCYDKSPYQRDISPRLNAENRLEPDDYTFKRSRFFCFFLFGGHERIIGSVVNCGQ